MRRPLESRLLAVPVAALVAAALVAHPVSAQASSQGPSTISVDQAQEFLGQWNLGITGGQGEEITLSIAIQDRDGRIAAEVAAEGLAGSEPVTRVSREGDRLVLDFMPVVQGQPIPVRIDLAPSGENLDAQITAADGMFMASGTATPQ